MPRARRFKGWDWTELAYRWGYRKPRRAFHECRQCALKVDIRAHDLCLRCGYAADERSIRDCILARLGRAMAAADGSAPADEGDRQTVADLREFLDVLATAEETGHGPEGSFARGYAPVWRAMATMPSDWHLLATTMDMLGRMWT